MKKAKFIFHPYTLITSFLLILISGEHIGGFYALYILLGLPHGAIHSIIGIIGIVILILTRKKYKDLKVYHITYFANLVGALLLILSLFLFFCRDKSNYNMATFHQTVPQIMLSVFLIITVAFLVNNISASFKVPPKVNMY
jgi:hypothetical protein